MKPLADIATAQLQEMGIIRKSDEYFCVYQERRFYRWNYVV